MMPKKEPEHRHCLNSRVYFELSPAKRELCPAPRGEAAWIHIANNYTFAWPAPIPICPAANAPFRCRQSRAPSRVNMPRFGQQAIPVCTNTFRPLPRKERRARGPGWVGTANSDPAQPIFICAVVVVFVGFLAQPPPWLPYSAWLNIKSPSPQSAFIASPIALGV